MKIERALFLALTGTLSAACIIVEHPKPPPPPPPPPPPVAASPQQASNKPPVKIVPVGPARPAHEVIVPVGPPHAQPQPSPAPTSPTPSPTVPPPPAPTPPPPSPPAACLDSNPATVPACSVSCPSNAFVAQRCAAYAADFDQKVAASAISCMNGLKAASACDSMQAYNCGKAALNQACADPTVTQLCQIAATPCKVAQNDCITMLSGLNSTGQDAVAQCVAKGCSAGLYSCIEGLSATSAGH
jgi:hypothetical protein